MAVDPSKFPEVTDAELLTIYRAAMAALGTGQSYSINGRTMTRVDIAEVRETITWLEARIDTKTGDGDVGVVTFDKPGSQGGRRFHDRRC